MTDVDVGAVTPTENVVESTPAQDTTAVTGEQKPAEAEKPVVTPKTYTEEEFQKAFQKRLGQESRRLERVARAEAEAAYLRQQLDATRTPSKPEGPPKPENFQSYDEYIDKLTDWKVEQKFGGLKQESSQQTLQQQEAAYAAQVAAKLGEAKAKYPDFEEVAYSPDVVISQAMAAAIAESDMGGDVAYYLGSNPDVAAKIARMAPTVQIREIAKIEAQLKAAPAPTKTPAPIVPNSGTSTGKKSLEDMDMDEFIKARRSQIAKRR